MEEKGINVITLVYLCNCFSLVFFLFPFICGCSIHMFLAVITSEPSHFHLNDLNLSSSEIKINVKLNNYGDPTSNKRQCFICIVYCL